MNLRIYPRLDLDISAAELPSALTAPPGAALQRTVEAGWPGPRRALAVLSVRTALDLLLHRLLEIAGRKR